MEEITSERAVKNARSSIEMEGLNVDAEMERVCAQILDGEYSLKEYLEAYSRKKTDGPRNGWHIASTLCSTTCAILARAF